MRKGASEERVAFSVREFGELFGRQPGWVYKLIRGGKLKVLRGYGALMIPACEVERIRSGGEALSDGKEGAA